jgi:hypothetical protein
VVLGSQLVDHDDLHQENVNLGRLAHHRQFGQHGDAQIGEQQLAQPRQHVMPLCALCLLFIA